MKFVKKGPGALNRRLLYSPARACELMVLAGPTVRRLPGPQCLLSNGGHWHGQNLPPGMEAGDASGDWPQ